MATRADTTSPCRCQVRSPRRAPTGRSRRSGARSSTSFKRFALRSPLTSVVSTIRRPRSTA
eukprot:6677866-Pyramimonas_sp.AAC.1